jgi:hypothetical protein
MKLAVNTNTNVIVHWYGWQRVYMRYSAPNSIARMSMVQMVRLCACCTTKLTSHSICLQWSDFIEYLLELLIQRQNWYALRFNDSLDGYQPNWNHATEYCVQEIGGRRSVTQARRCLRQRWILLSQGPSTNIQRIVSTIAINIYISVIVIPLSWEITTMAQR